MNPIATLSLGGTVPLAPQADDRTTYGTLAATNALLHRLLKNRRRFMLNVFTEAILILSGRQIRYRLRPDFTL
jgi:hypothetical protein